MTQIKVLIVEDEPIIAKDIQVILLQNDYQVTSVAYNKSSAIQSLSNHTPDIALLDIGLGNNMDGFDVANEINKNYSLPFLYLTSYSSKQVVDKAKHTRPMGYVLKPFDEADLYSAIEIGLYNYAQNHKPKDFSRASINEMLLTNITPKEFDILKDIYDGKTNKQMAEKHFVSMSTIKTHVQKVYDKLDTHTRSETIATIRGFLN